MTCSVSWNEFSIDQWSHLLQEGSKKDHFIYQICTYSKGLSLSYEVMTSSDYETKYKSLRSRVSPFIRFSELISPIVTVCQRETKKMPLVEILELTEHYLSPEYIRAYLETVDREGLKSILKREVAFVGRIFQEEKITIEEGMKDLFQPFDALLSSIDSFYQKKIVPRREGILGRLRELISLIQDIFHKCRKDAFSDIQFAKGARARYYSMVKSVKEAKKHLCKKLLQEMEEHIRSHTEKLDSQDLLQTPSRQSLENAPYPVTPLFEKLSTLVREEDKPILERMKTVRDDVNQYLKALG